MVPAAATSAQPFPIPGLRFLARAGLVWTGAFRLISVRPVTVMVVRALAPTPGVIEHGTQDGGEAD
jgi:hypothetical protein